MPDKTAFCPLLDRKTSDSNYHLTPCPHCGGRLFKDREDEEWHCINCARSYPVNSDNHNGETELIPGNSAETTKAPEGVNETLSHENETPQVHVPKPKKSRRSIAPPKEWYALPQIRFAGEEIIWILTNRELLEDGRWPPEPITSGYTDLPTIKRKGGKNAPFTKPVEIIAEVERRLEHCGLDGLMVYLHYAYEWDEYILSKYYRISVTEVRFRIEAVIYWISGWNFYIDRPFRRWHVYRSYGAWSEKQRKD